MLEYSYSLKRDEGDEVRTFVPEKIPTKLPDIVCIEGPNSSGKSTLLNILAVGFHGLKLEKLNPDLRRRMQSLASSPHQSLEFEFRITNAKDSVVLISKKGSYETSEVVVKEVDNGKEKTLGSEAFQRKYNLIYDIPDNPTERLNSLVDELRDFQSIYSSRVGALSSYILQTITEIKSARDPARISVLDKKVSRDGEEIKRLRTEIAIQKEVCEKREKFWLSRSFADMLDKWLQVKERLDRMDGMKSTIKKRERKEETKLDKQKQIVARGIEDMKDLHSEIASLMGLLIRGEDKVHVDKWALIDLDVAWKEYEYPASLTREMREFRGALQRLVPETSRKKIEEAKVYSDLIEFLKKYRFSEVIIPGLEKTVEDFIDILQSASKKYEVLQTLASNVHIAFEKLDAMEQKRRDTEKLLAELRTMKAKSPEQDEEYGLREEELQQRIDRFNEQLAAVEAACDSIRMKCAKHDISEDSLGKVLSELSQSEELSPYLNYDSGQLEKAVEYMKSEIQRLDGGLDRLVAQNNMDKKELTRLQDMKPHKYQDDLDDLDRLHKKSLLLEQRLKKSFNGYVRVLAGDIPPSKTAEESRYFEEVAKFLGRKLGRVRHLDKEYGVTSVDLIGKQILTKEKKIIRLSDMGTGQSQSAYLLGLLNIEDNRKIIALFDEVAMMDSKSLEPIYRKLNQLYRNGRLLLGVVVQKADAVKVTSRIEAG